MINALALCCLFYGAQLGSGDSGVALETQGRKSCATMGTMDSGAVVPFDCEGDLEIVMHVFLAADDPFDDCSAGCDQTFIVRCEDYWSEQHRTDKAIVRYHAAGPDDQITVEALRTNGRQGRFHVRRKLSCDGELAEFPSYAECAAFACAPECCREVLHLLDVVTGEPVVVDETTDRETLPCFVLEVNPFVGVGEQRDAIPPNNGVHPPAGAGPSR